MLKEFREFAMKGNVLDMAAAAASSKSVLTSFCHLIFASPRRYVS